jgi:hypothetical protein
MAGYRDGLKALGLEFTGYRLAGVRLAAGNHHPGATAGHFLSNGAPDALGGSGDQGYLAGHIKQWVRHESAPAQCVLG